MILVTGASGFLGQHLVHFLSDRGERVRALYYNNPPSLEMSALPFVEWVQCDMLDVYALADAMQGITSVYHCAAIVSYDPKKSDEMLHFNLESTANLINNAVELDTIVKLVHVSSIAALTTGNKDKSSITENDEWTDNRYYTAYGMSKYLAEMEVWRGIGEGLNAVIVNPGIILGGGSRNKSSSQLLQLADREFPFYTGGATAWVDVEDVVHIMYMLMNGKDSETRFILSCGNYAYHDVLTMMAHALKRKPAHIRAGDGLTGIIWRTSKIKSLFTGKPPLITRETARNAITRSSYDNSKLLQAFPDFTYQNIEKTIQKMVNQNKT